MYSLWSIYKEKLSSLVNQIYMLLQKWNLALVSQIINTETSLQSPSWVTQPLTGEQMKALFIWHESLFPNNEKKRIQFFFGNFIIV